MNPTYDKKDRVYLQHQLVFVRQKRNMETNAKIVNEVEEVSLDLKVVFGHSCETKDNLCSSSSFPVMFRCFLMISLPVCIVSCDRLCLMHLWLNLFISHFLSLQFKGILSLHFDRWSSFSVRISWQQHSNLEHSVQAVHEDCFNERYTKSVTPSVSLSLSVMLGWLSLYNVTFSRSILSSGPVGCLAVFPLSTQVLEDPSLKNSVAPLSLPKTFSRSFQTRSHRLLDILFRHDRNFVLQKKVTLNLHISLSGSNLITELFLSLGPNCWWWFKENKRTKKWWKCWSIWTSRDQ